MYARDCVVTVTFTILCSKKGTQVTGIDITPKMLEVSMRKVEEAKLTDQIDLQELSFVHLGYA